MAYARVTRATNGRGAIEYALGTDKGHNDNEFRNEYISMVNMFEGVDPIEQMQKYWLKARNNHTTQVLRVVQSFSKNEFDPENPNDVLTANILGTEFANKHYPGRQSMVFTQTDGKSGLVHNHIIINDVHMETSKGCDKKQYYWKQVGKWTDEITGEYTTLDKGQKSKDKISQTERAKRELGKYVWKDDLKERVKKSMEEATSKEDFLERLEANGIGFREGKSKNHGKYFTYELKDLSKVPEGEKLPNRKLKARSFKLGDDFGPHALEIKLASKDKDKEEVAEDKKEMTEEKYDAKQFAAETLKRVKEKIKKEEEQAEEERKQAEQLEAKEDIIEEEFKGDIDYSKPIEDNHLLEDSYERVESNQKMLREEIDRVAKGTENYRRRESRAKDIRLLMNDIELKQDEDFQYE